METVPSGDVSITEYLVFIAHGKIFFSLLFLEFHVKVCFNSIIFSRKFTSKDTSIDTLRIGSYTYVRTVELRRLSLVGVPVSSSIITTES